MYNEQHKHHQKFKSSLPQQLSYQNKKIINNASQTGIIDVDGRNCLQYNLGTSGK